MIAALPDAQPKTGTLAVVIAAARAQPAFRSGGRMWVTCAPRRTRECEHLRVKP